MRVTWLRKTLERAKRGDIEGNYRLLGLIGESLQYYFELRNMWFLGSKKSFAWLADNDPHTYELYQCALQTPHDLDIVAKLLARLPQ